MKRLFQWVLAAALIGGASVFTSCIKDDNPATPNTPHAPVLSSVRITGPYIYGTATVNYEHDAAGRLVKDKEVNDDGVLIRDLNYTYSPGHISITGLDEFAYETIECTLDAEGRIIEIKRKSVTRLEGNISEYTYLFTYYPDGHLQTETKAGGGSSMTNTWIWENDELVKIDTEDSSVKLLIEFEPSDAPAQDLLYLMTYNGESDELCPQGCLGKLPKHLPKTKKISTIVNGVTLYTTTLNYTYGVENGRLVSVLDENGVTRTLSWKSF
jgi:hypothetical protein